MTPAAGRTGSTTVFKDTGEVSGGGVLVWHLQSNAKLTEVLLLLPLLNTHKVMCFVLSVLGFIIAINSM